MPFCFQYAIWNLLMIWYIKFRCYGDLDVTCVQEFIYPFTCILHEGEIDKQLKVLLEGLLQFGKQTSRYNMM